PANDSTGTSGSGRVGHTPVLYGPALGLGMESARYHSGRGEYAQMAVDVAAVTAGLHGVRQASLNDVIVYTEKGPIPLSELAPTCPATRTASPNVFRQTHSIS